MGLSQYSLGGVFLKRVQSGQRPFGCALDIARYTLAAGWSSKGMTLFENQMLPLSRHLPRWSCWIRLLRRAVLMSSASSASVRKGIGSSNIRCKRLGSLLAIAGVL